MVSSKRMRSVSAHRKLELDEQFVGGETVAVAGTAELSADLAELARPVGEQKRAPSILDERGKRPVAGGHSVRDRGLTGAALGAVETAAEEPAACELIIGGGIVAEGADLSDGSRRCEGREGDGRARPDELGAGGEGVVDGAAERLPAQRSV